jgi:tetratricopeptide (TPR) repeat protein/capsular polysaccharide biosynthesis protein
MIRGESLFKNIKFHLTRGEWERVIDIAQQAIAVIDNSAEINNAEAVELYDYLAKAYAQQGKLVEATSAYQKILELAGEQPEVYAELGLLHSKLKIPARAISYYQRALKLKPNWPELQYNLAVVLHQLNNWQGAIAAYNKAIELKPDYAAVYFNLGVLYDQRGEPEAAIALYQQAIALEPNLLRAYSNLGNVLVKQRQYQQAISVFKQGISFDPTWTALHNNLGQVYWLDGNLGLAFKSFETAIILNPKMALAHHNLGRLWQHQGNYERAIACFKRVIELEPNNILAHSNCAAAYQTIGDLESTLACWRTIIKLQPEFVEAYCQNKSAIVPQDLLETAKLSCARFLEALRQEQTIEAYDLLWRTYDYMGDVLFEFGGVDGAEYYYQQAIALEPQTVELYLKLGNCLALQKRFDAAVAIYNLGLLLEPDHPQICFQLGKVLERTQEAEIALQHYESVLNQQMPSAANWSKLPKLFTAEENKSALPSKIYHYTQDWVRDCQLQNFNYVQISWSETIAPYKAKQKRQPETIQVTTPGKTLHPDCGGVNCTRCMKQQIEHFQPVQIGRDAFKCSLEEAVAIEAGLPFVVTIPQGKTWIAPQTNSWMICHAIAVITPDNYLLGDLSRNYPWFLPECPYQERPEHSIYHQNLPVLEKIEGRVTLLSGLAGHVYYHWMFDILPRLELLQRSGIRFDEIDWFVINSMSKTYQQETLKLLGVPLEKIIESDRHSYIQATELIVPSFPGYMDWVGTGTIKFLRQTFLPHVTQSKTHYSKIYISRAKAKNRQLVNELEVSQLLHTQGFETIFLEELSVLEQIRIFVNAKIIVAPHGSGLTNLVFCSPETKVVELFSPNYIRTDYWMVSQQLQLEHYYLVGKSFDSSLGNLMYQNALTEDILVDLDSLKLILRHLSP